MEEQRRQEHENQGNLPHNQAKHHNGRINHEMNHHHNLEEGFHRSQCLNLDLSIMFGEPANTSALHNFSVILCLALLRSLLCV